LRELRLHCHSVKRRSQQESAKSGGRYRCAMLVAVQISGVTMKMVGTFDVFHVGHLCRYRADILVMGDDWAGKFDDFSWV
jgi:hypothetical protein